MYQTSKKKLKILMVASEAVPFAKSGGLADAVSALARELRSQGHDVRLIMPYYRCVADRGFAAAKTGQATAIGLMDSRHRHGCRLRRLEHQGLSVYFVENDAFFNRGGLYGYAQGDYPDNARRFGLFARAVLSLLPGLGWQPDLLHLNDWQTALVPALLKTEFTAEPFYSRLATLLTIHNLGYQGNFPLQALPALGLPPAMAQPERLGHRGQISLLKGGILASDLVTTVSATYRREILTDGTDHGFAPILQRRREDLFAVPNGLDTHLWDPETDDALACRYGPADMAGKAACKAALQRELGLSPEPRRPLLAAVSRLDRQKGLDLITASWDKMMRRGVQFVLLGSGENELERLFLARAGAYPGRAAIRIGFDEGLARRIYAGGDLLLMPSRYEPCGLAQLIALRYGTLPLARETGGLADTVFDLDQGDRPGNGFSFAGPQGRDFLACLDRALARYRGGAGWLAAQHRGMTAEYGWRQPAEEYQRLYHLALEIGSERRDRQRRQGAG